MIDHCSSCMGLLLESESIYRSFTLTITKSIESRYLLKGVNHMSKISKHNTTPKFTNPNPTVSLVKLAPIELYGFLSFVFKIFI